MQIRYTKTFLLLLVGMGVSSCVTTGGSDSTPAGATVANDNMDGTLWMQTSIEYAAVTTGIYAAATAELSEIAASGAVSIGKGAIVLDIDETVLDNSRYQAQLVNDNRTFESESWDRWIAQRKATAVPGVVGFIRSGQSLGFHVAFVTNRACRIRPDTSDYCPQKRDTLTNLADVGIDTASITLYLKGEKPPEACGALLSPAEQTDGKWSSDKTSRRECIRLGHEIVMLFGDQLGDFTEVENRSFEQPGRDVAAQYEARWGKSWFMLPNPTYGDWRPRTPAGKRSLIQGID